MYVFHRSKRGVEYRVANYLWDVRRFKDYVPRIFENTDTLTSPQDNIGFSKGKYSSPCKDVRRRIKWRRIKCIV
jgi:hypothetical protein